MIASVSTALKLLKQLASTPNIGLSELARILKPTNLALLECCVRL